MPGRVGGVGGDAVLLVVGAPLPGQQEGEGEERGQQAAPRPSGD
ncbi:hypothetical protein ACIRD8_06245 [Streptomyces sp. NPDC102451]